MNMHSGTCVLPLLVSCPTVLIYNYELAILRRHPASNKLKIWNPCAITSKLALKSLVTVLLGLRPPLKQVLCSYQIYTLKHMFHHYWAHFLYVFPCDSIGKFPANQETQEDGPSCPRWGIFAGKGHGHPLQYSFLEHHGQRNLACYSPLHLKETDMSKVAEHACRKQLMCLWVFLVVQMVKTLPEMQETWVQFLSHGKITWRS